MHITLQTHTFIKDCSSCHMQLQLRGREGFVSKCQGFYCKRSPSDLLFLPRTLTAFHLIRFNLEKEPQGINNCTRRCKACMSASVCVSVRVMYTECTYTIKNSLCSYNPTFQNKGHPYLCISFLIGWGCGCLAGELEDVMWEHYAICFPLSGSLFYFLCPSVSALLVPV